MAWTARPDEDKKEYFDSEDDLERKATLMAEWIRESKHMIVFTGAGISTAAGIPDFRSGMDTKVETGPGAWELRAQGKSRDRKFRTVRTTQAIPTPTHMMFVKLYQEGLLKAVISQNCDGLHRRSGMPADGLFELHGNSNVEKCKKCNREYLRDFDVISRGLGRYFSHETGRVCDDPACRGHLMDTIINFGENLPRVTLEKSFDHGLKADLCLAMGSSLTVTPAADIPKEYTMIIPVLCTQRHCWCQEVGKSGSRLVIVNLQSTPLDRLTKMRVHTKCDDFSKLVMSKLGLEIPEFRLKRRVALITEKIGSMFVKISVEGKDAQGLPFTFLREVQFGMDPGDPTETCLEEPFYWTIEQEEGKTSVFIKLLFQAHYGEPDVDLPLIVDADKPGTVDVSLEYNPFTGEWKVQRSDEKPNDGTKELASKMEAAKI